MYALNISATDGRILSATFKKYAPSSAVFVNELPEGDISDFLYVDGVFVYDPIPKQEMSEENPTTEQRIAELEEALELLLSGVTE